jgi:hypothetical protein
LLHRKPRQWDVIGQFQFEFVLPIQALRNFEDSLPYKSWGKESIEMFVEENRRVPQS